MLIDPTLYTLPELPGQGFEGPVIDPAAPGSGLTVTEYAEDAVPVLHGLEGVTVMEPETAEADVLTVMELVPEPELMLKPVGSVHA